MAHGGYGFRPYVPVARRRLNALRFARKRKEEGRPLHPVVSSKRKIATSVWGQAWCDHIESFHDFHNRLPRGRSYLRNGSVIDLSIERGEIRGLVAGSEIYTQSIPVLACTAAKWSKVKANCRGAIASVVELLEGRISADTMAQLSGVEGGLFPDLAAVELHCDCPDWSLLCKHLAAVLYGVGVRLDKQPELLFELRGVDPAELTTEDSLGLTAKECIEGGDIPASELDELFGITLMSPERPEKRPHSTKKKKGAGKAARRRAGTKVTRKELLALGVPPGTISGWLFRRDLERCPQRGVYKHTASSIAKLRAYD